MKFTLFVLFGLVAAVALARPDSVLDLDLDDIHHDQDIDDDQVITGTYSWTSPEGEEFFVKYIADDDGYRVVESNAVPASADGVRANGQQGSFGSSEEFDDRK
ncbi:cuticular protein 47Eg-like [Macrobrachium rosenbergii]|uniref:cuticular protein 47Eg-like n=1 Tax=Macrobrachium rosenbergii TaxID=79674 RepID=UPI0034D69988